MTLTLKHLIHATLQWI